MKRFYLLTISFILVLKSFGQSCIHNWDPPNLLGRWELNYNECVDFSPNDNDGEVFSTQPEIDRCDYLQEGSLLFNGQSSHCDITMSNLPLGNLDMTLSFWFKSEITTKQTLVFIGSLIDSNFIKVYLNESNHLTLSVKNKTYITQWISPQNQWNHVTVTKMDSKVLFYINSLKVDSTNIPLISIQQPSIRFGWDSQGDYFKGQMDQVKMMGISLTSPMVWLNYINVNIVNLDKGMVNKVEVYPNPTKDFFTIRGFTNPKVVDIFNREIKINPYQDKISVKEWKSGFYTVIDGVKRVRLIVE